MTKAKDTPIAELSKTSRDRLRGLENLRIEASPFLATRVLANLEGRRAERKRSAVWRWIAVSVPALALAFAIAVWTRGDGALSAQVGSAYALKVSLESVDTSGIAVARIELPPGVKFASKSFAGLGETRFLEVPGSALAALGSLPLVIEGSVAGTKSIIVRFLDQERRLVFEKEVLIRFEG